MLKFVQLISNDNVKILTRLGKFLNTAFNIRNTFMGS